MCLMCRVIGDNDVSNVLSPRNLVFRPDLSDINWTFTIETANINIITALHLFMTWVGRIILLYQTLQNLRV